MAKKMVMPVAWAQDVDCWLETLKAAGFSDDTVRSRRYKIARLCRELPSPMETTGEQITRVFAAHDTARRRMRPTSFRDCRREQ